MNHPRQYQPNDAVVELPEPQLYQYIWDYARQLRTDCYEICPDPITNSFAVTYFILLMEKHILKKDVGLEDFGLIKYSIRERHPQSPNMTANLIVIVEKARSEILEILSENHVYLPPLSVKGNRFDFILQQLRTFRIYFSGFLFLKNSRSSLFL